MSQLLISELTALASEAKRKHSDIKQAADHALSELKAKPDLTLKAAQLGNGAEDNILLKPILLSCQTKTPKVVSLSMALLQRVILMKLAPSSAIPQIVDTLHQLLTPLNRVDVDVQLKILQIASALLSSYPSIHNELLSSTLLLCFKLQEGSKVAVVSSTAAATLRQSVMTVFDKVKEEDDVLDAIKDGGEDAPLAALTVELEKGSVTLFPCSRDAYLLFSDLCALASGEDAPFLSLSSLSKTFSLELIESVLTNHSKLFKPSMPSESKANSHPELLLILRSKTCPLLIKALSETPVFPTHLRLMRLLFLLLRQFSNELVLEVEILMNILLRFVQPSTREERHTFSLSSSPSTPMWQRVLALEVVRSLCSDPVFLRNLWVWYDSKAANAEQVDDSLRKSSLVFGKLVEALQTVALEGESILALNAAMIVDSQSRLSLNPDTPRKSRLRESMDRSYSGLYEAAAGVANAAISGVFSGSEADLKSGTEVLTASSAPSIQLIDQLDKAEPPAAASPALPKTYPQLLVLQSTLLLCQGLSGFVLPIFSSFANSRPQGSAPAPPAMTEADIQALSDPFERDSLSTAKSMIAFSGPMIRQILSFLLKIKSADPIFEEVLVAFRNFTNTTGALSLTVERDRMIFTLAAFSVPLPSQLTTTIHEEKVLGETGGVTVSERNLACLKIMTQVAYYLSGSLGRSWKGVLGYLCDAEALLERVAIASGHSRKVALVSGHEEADSDEMATTTLSSLTTSASMSMLDFKAGKELQVLVSATLEPSQLRGQIRRVFENSTALEQSAFQDFVTCLCELSREVAGVRSPAPPTSPSAKPTGQSAHGRQRSASGQSREPSEGANFIIDSIGLVTSLNIERLTRLQSDKGWDEIVGHLLDLCCAESGLPKWRIQSAEVLDSTLFSGMGIEPLSQAKEDKARIQRQVLDALAKQAILSERKAAATDVDVRRMGVETLQRILEAYGHALLLGWETIFEICSSVCKPSQGLKVSPTSVPSTPNPNSRRPNSLIKIGFASLQLVCSDFLSALDLDQLELCISCLTDYGSQQEDVNVALTANGTLWGVTAEMSGRQGGHEPASMTTEADSDDARRRPLTELWMYLLRCILRVTGDPRAEVRNGAISNLFRVLEQYGSSLDENVWQAIMWEILFPLHRSLEDTAIQAERDAPESDQTEAEERRNEAMGIAQSEPRQWDESRVLAFNSLGRVVRDLMMTKIVRCQDFERIWSCILDLIQRSFLMGPPPISQAAIRALSQILSVPLGRGSSENEVLKAWRSSWEMWSSVGSKIDARRASTDVEDGDSPKMEGRSRRPFTQANLLALIECFEPIYSVISAEFTLEQVELLISCLRKCIVYKESPDNQPDVDQMTPLQAAYRSTLASLKPIEGLPTLLLCDIADSLTLAFSLAQDESGTVNGEAATAAGKYPVTFVGLAKACIQETISSYTKWSDELGIYKDGAVERIFSSLAVPIKLKYDCPPPSQFSKAKKVRPLWQSSTEAFCQVSRRCCIFLDLRGNELEDDNYQGLWRRMTSVLTGCLDSDCWASLQLDEEIRLEDEEFDLRVLATLERDILPFLGSERVPRDLIENVARSLCRSSRLYHLQGGGEGVEGRARAGTSSPPPWVGSDREGGVKKETKVGTNGRQAGFESSERESRGGGYGTRSKIQALPRERFGYWSFDLLFLICSDRWKDRLEERKRIASIFLPTLLERSNSVLENYTLDSKVRGDQPFPRLREEELNFTLDRLSQLRIWRGTMSSMVVKDEGREDQDERDKSRQNLLGIIQRESDRAHLFSCYKLLCDLLMTLVPRSEDRMANVGTSLPNRWVPHPFGVEEEEQVQGGGVQVRVGKENVLESVSLDRRVGPVSSREIIRSLLDLVGKELGL
ncbi:hypothetical protein IE53DRAFT_43521 [Violaceomyces palustris]|uniref:Uncharacterized protein n=1 Tax=Violaceomyces palustris TaxID=1673888 RepID=A0ACD0P0Q8_9BASI|nr:hypothetical protein IE53DRAFT_43521 [Violaceomyces palustris]